MLAFAMLPAGAAVPNGDTVVIAQGVDVDTLDPIKSTPTTTDNVLQNVFDKLVVPDAKTGLQQPSLATRWHRVAPKVWEYTLRTDVKFSNGDPLTSEDVKFTYDKLKDPGFKSAQAPYGDSLERVEAPAPNIVRFVTKEPAAFPAWRPEYIKIVDAKYWREKGDAYMPTHPIGSGPYTVRAWRKDEEVVLDARSDYWGPKPRIAHAIFRPIPENAARVAALRTGDIDIATNFPAQNVEQVSHGANTQVAITPSLRVLFIAIDQLHGGPGAEKLVRQAMNYAVDVPTVIKAVARGYGRPVATPIAPGFTGYDAKATFYHHDAAKAKELLAKAGLSNGFSFTINTPKGRYANDYEVAQAIAGQLSAIGINTTVKTDEWAIYQSKLNAKNLTPAYLLGWSNYSYDADNTLTPLLYSTSNRAYWKNPQFDSLVEKARYELDPIRRNRVYAEIATMLHDEAPWIFLYQMEDLYGKSKRLNWKPRPDEALRLMEMSLR